MTTYFQQDLYGGCITVELPTGYIDGSTLRQVPDHQELFLSSQTLNSIIFEINDYVSEPTDNDAAQFHFTDVISPPDHLCTALPSATTVSPLPASSLRNCPALLLAGEIVGPEPPQNRSNIQTTTVSDETKTYVVQLLVRIREHATDICVRFNVPYKELTTERAQGSEREVADRAMQRIVETLDVKDWSLFGTQD